jgi:hypothetical protein
MPNNFNGPNSGSNKNEVYFEEHVADQDPHDIDPAELQSARDSLINHNLTQEQLNNREAEMKKAFEFDEAA